MTRRDDEFESFAAEARPRLIRGLVPSRGIDGPADARLDRRPVALVGRRDHRRHRDHDDRVVGPATL